MGTMFGRYAYDCIEAVVRAREAWVVSPSLLEEVKSETKIALIAGLKERQNWPLLYKLIEYCWELTNKRPRSCLVLAECASKMSTSGPYGMPLVFRQHEVQIGMATG